MAKFEQTTTGKLGGTESPKSIFWGSGPFSMAWYGPKNQNYRKMKENIRGYSSRVPKKPYIVKFEQTHDWENWGN